MFLYSYREQVEQRRMKMERLLEWQRDLVDKLGVTIHELQEIPLPSEEELDRLKDHLEKLQAERDKRAEIFLNVQVEVKDIMGKLHGLKKFIVNIMFIWMSDWCV